MNTRTAAIQESDGDGAPSPARTGLQRLLRELALIAAAAALAYWLLVLATHSPLDAAWSTSGLGSDRIHNWGGRVGAWLADLSYYAAGLSVWWLPLAAARLWASAFAGWLRGGPAAPRWSLRLGLPVLLLASCVLEWSRLYRLESALPGPAGGILGQLAGPAAVQWLGFTGSGLVAVTLLVLAVAWVFGFSWARVAEGLGGWVDGLWTRWRERRELAQDLALGRQAARERARERAEPLLDAGADADGAAPAARGSPSASAVAEPVIAPVPRAGSAAPVPAAGDAAPVRPTPLAAQPAAAAAAPAPAPARSAVPPVLIEPTLAEVPLSERVAKERQKPLFSDLPDSRLPKIDLLDAPPGRQETVAHETLEMTSRLIEKKLKDFGVEVRVVLAQPGPVITRYEIEPATGVKGSQIVNLAKDLARSLSLVSIRVIETIPGKNYMALELPNARRQSIRLSEILGSQPYHESKSLLTLGLGKDIVGHPVVVDLARMPHLLVAGTTGSGKSVGINAMILSLLYKAEARDVRLLMIDPKMLEMSVYEGIPHLLAPVVTDMKQAAHGLNWCVAEMERRYRLMSKLGVRNLGGYNARIDEARARGEQIPNPFSLTPDSPEPLQRLPHIVVVIDELADLMMVVGKKIEELIARLAQKARAAGIHLILATQRPSVDVITGLIKANIPTRIAFQVSSKIDSRTILDQMGAEALLGMGDMLYLASGTGLPVRVHGAFVSDDEVHRVVAWLKANQGPPDYIDGVLEGGTVEGEDGVPGGTDGGGEQDPLYDQAVEVVLKNRKASISLVQRHLKIGYNRAARLVEDMERAGLVSPMNSAGQRDILVPAREA